MRKFDKFLKQWYESYDSIYWSELDLDYCKQGYDSWSKEDVDLIYKLVLKLEKN